MTNILPSMLMGDELNNALSVLPAYNPEICSETVTNRLIALSDIYKVYYPLPMSTEIYCKLYLALVRSQQKKNIDIITKQCYKNLTVQNQDYSGIIGGMDSFTIIGSSGIGKSRAIGRAISIISNYQIIEVPSLNCKIIPILVVQCPFDSSLKGFLLEILRKVDELLNTKYYQDALRAKATTDRLIGLVSQVCLNHIGILVVDEAQNVVNSKNGSNLVGSLTQLINNSSISICFVGTDTCIKFFESAFQLARRSIGLYYGALPYDEHFYNACKTLFEYQYTTHRSEISYNIANWLYEHRGGILAVVVSLIHDAQEIAILSGSEALDIDTLNKAYKKRTGLLHGYLDSKSSSYKVTKTENTLPLHDLGYSTKNEHLLFDIVNKAKSEQADIVKSLREYLCITEIKV